MSKGILVVVSGFSGSGKGTVMKRLMEKYDNYALSVSVTTRNPRPGEKDGEAYFFRTKEEFEQLIREDGLIEYAQYVAVSYTHLRANETCADLVGKAVMQTLKRVEVLAVSYTLLTLPTTPYV